MGDDPGKLRGKLCIYPVFVVVHGYEKCGSISC
jgi:hypothetical protein